MIIGHLGLSTVIISLDSFTATDLASFTRHWNEWLLKVNTVNSAFVEPYHHLLNMATNNSLALNETSNTITQKWTDLFKTNKDWKSFFDTSPFKVSVTKVRVLTIIIALQVNHNIFLI